MSMARDSAMAPTQQTTVEMTYREAVRTAMADEMREDSRVILFGEDIAEPGGPFKTAEGLLAEFGPQRVMSTPISEAGFVGAALGMAVAGMRPIAEIMFADFLPSAGDALVNELPKFRLMSGGQTGVPVTIRAIGGATGRFGTQHSATAESWFQQMPGLLVVTASSPAAAYGLLRTSIRLDDPVLFLEHKGMYNRKGPVHRGSDALPTVGRAEVLLPGDDVTIVATLLMVERSLKAAEMLAASGIRAEIIDLRWVTPMDVDTVGASVSRTGRLLVVEEQVHPGGWGATLISMLAQDGVRWRAKPRALSIPNVPTSFSPPLEDAALPTSERIETAVREMMRSEESEPR
jgi:pyruvate/2-oxoglutarate/acetoin dehydrogenase E1 component